MKREETVRGGAAQLAGQARAKARAIKFNNKIFKY